MLILLSVGQHGSVTVSLISGGGIFVVNSYQFPRVVLFLGNGIFVQCCDGCAVGLTPVWVPSYCHVLGICAKLVYADPSDAQLF